jgi:hypothetical protein
LNFNHFSFVPKKFKAFFLGIIFVAIASLFPAFIHNYSLVASMMLLNDFFDPAGFFRRFFLWHEKKSGRASTTDQYCTEPQTSMT